MTEFEYRNYPAINRSLLMHIKDSPEKFQYFKDNPPPPTPALIFGQALHKLVLEIETFPDEFAIAPKVDLRTKAGKEQMKYFKESMRGKTIITADDYAVISEMAKAIDKNVLCKALLSGEKEVPYFWTDELTGEQCKCRADCITKIEDTTYIVDLKTCDNAETSKFRNKAIDLGYHVQVAMYMDGVKANIGGDCAFVFIAIEKKPPYSINILLADDYLIQYGYDEYRHLLGMYHECKQDNNWYGYLGKFNEINSLGIPPWIAKEYKKEG